MTKEADALNAYHDSDTSRSDDLNCALCISLYSEKALNEIIQSEAEFDLSAFGFQAVGS